MNSGPEARIIFYDGHCGLCHGFVRFLLRVDDGARFHFAPLQGSTAGTKLEGKTLPDSIVYLNAEAELRVKSQAIWSILRDLGGVWAIPGALLCLVPQRFADWCYDLIAKYRKSIFGSPAELCPMVPAELRKSFLP